MATKPKTNLTVEQYLKAYVDEPAGRYELVNGTVVTMAAETARHVRAKLSVYSLFNRQVEKLSSGCEVFGDGMTIKINEKTAREPDVSVQCGESVDDDSVLLDNPVIVVEVISPSSEFRDTHGKLIEYFTIPSIQHYLIVDQSREMVVHHHRVGNEISTRILRKGTIELSPPGFAVEASELLGEK